jgi:hypothetical protein
MQPMALACLRDSAQAEALRRALWEDMAFGDPVDQAPELDGQNGMSQIFILAAQIGVPMRRIMCMPDSDNEIIGPVYDQRGKEWPFRNDPADDAEPHFLVMRYRRGHHSTNARLQPTPIVASNGSKYRLVAILIGSEFCGHQIAAAAPTDDVRRWAVADSDARRLGIGPMHWRIDTSKATTPEEKVDVWWKSWRTAIPAINYGKGVCDLSPHNAPVSELNGTTVKVTIAARSMNSLPIDESAGLTNIDLLYIRCGKS